MRLKELSITILDKKYDIKLNFLDSGNLNGVILLAKIKSEEEKLFTYEFIFVGTYLSGIRGDLQKFAEDKALEIIKNLIFKGNLKDKVINFYSHDDIRMSDPPYELQKY